MKQRSPQASLETPQATQSDEGAEKQALGVRTPERAVAGLVVRLPLPPRECSANFGGTLRARIRGKMEFMALQCGMWYDRGSEMLMPLRCSTTSGAMLDTLEVPSMAHYTPNAWTAEEDALLRDLYLTLSAGEIGARIGKSPSAVRNRCLRLRISGKHAAWTDGEIATLRAWYGERTNQPLQLGWLAAQLGRSVNSMEQKAARLGFAAEQGKRLRVPRAADGLTASERADLPRYGRRGSEALRREQSLIAKARIVAHGHPRGALGMKHTDETKARLAEMSREWHAATTPEQREAMYVKRNETNIERYGTGNPAMLGQSNPYSRTKSGKRADLDNRFFRSSWEANYARYLNWLKEQGQIAEWQYEAQTFVFHGVTRGVLTYTPDFKVIEKDGSYCWHEVKGWMDPASKAKLKRMAKFYPGEKIIVIGEDEYKALAKWKALIPEWETMKRD